jgi:Fanconi anemia group M protein
MVEGQIKEHPNSKILIFTQYRDTASHLVEQLIENRGLIVERFVGQASKQDDPGLSQDEQAEILRNFRDGDTNALVATCIAEEGLDIPSVDLVVFYEPIPSEIRYIQRKGRTRPNVFQ